MEFYGKTLLSSGYMLLEECGQEARISAGGLCCTGRSERGVGERVHNPPPPPPFLFSKSR